MDLNDAKTRWLIRNNLMRKTQRHYLICEALRLLYDEIHDMEDKDKITELLIDSMIMAKKMMTRLQYYKHTYDDQTGNQGKNIKKLIGVVARRAKRLERKLK